MKQRTTIELKELFNECESEFPDKSTEFLLEYTAEMARIRKIKFDCDCGDVAEAIAHE